MQPAQAAVDVNNADAAALQSIKGVGPGRAKSILEERQKNGLYKDAADLASRIKGISMKSVEKLQKEGLTVGHFNQVKAPSNANEPLSKPSSDVAHRASQSM
jgi:competence protein ComEA